MFDICIIGGGTAGIAAAKTASDFNLKTVLFEKADLGGVCLNNGCIKSKVYLECLQKNPVNEIYEKFDKIRNSFAKKNKADLIKNSVDIIEANAEILGKNGEVFIISANGKIFECKYLIIASGSIPKNIGIDFPKNEDEIPESVNIVGGGISGFEAAEIFNSLGSKVSVYEISDKFCANLSQNAIKILTDKMQKNGITFHKNHNFDITKKENIYFANGRSFEKISGLENLGLEITEKGILTNEFCETSVKNVFAIGDINGKSMLAHTASIEAFSAVNKIVGNEIAINYENIPIVLYTNPSIERVGVLPENNEKYEVRQMPLSGNGKWRAETEAGDRGLCEAVIEKETQQVVGIHLISPSADEIITAATVIVQQNLTVKDVEKLVFPHPTISEILKDTILHGQKT